MHTDLLNFYCVSCLKHLIVNRLEPIVTPYAALETFIDRAQILQKLINVLAVKRTTV